MSNVYKNVFKTKFYTIDLHRKMTSGCGLGFPPKSKSKPKLLFGLFFSIRFGFFSFPFFSEIKISTIKTKIQWPWIIYGIKEIVPSVQVLRESQLASTVCGKGKEFANWK